MKNSKQHLLAPFIFLLVSAALQAAGQENSPASHLHSVDAPNIHNMLVVGKEAVFLSHLPMFQESGGRPMPRRYQAILEVSFEKQGGTPQEEYVKDRQSHPATKIYTLNPQRFVLPALASSGSQPPLRSFTGTVYRGHLEKLQSGEDSILSDVVVNVNRVVHFRELDPQMRKPAQLEYILFGKGEELFLAHFITAPPDFDQVLAVRITGHQFGDEELAKGIKVIFPGTKNTASTRLKEKQQVEGRMELNSAASPTKIRVHVNRELYFEEGELQVPPIFETTREEKRNGFF